MTSLEDQPQGKCFVIILVSDPLGSNAVQSLEARARFSGCGDSRAGHLKAPSTGVICSCCSVMVVPSFLVI